MYSAEKDTSKKEFCIDEALLTDSQFIKYSRYTTQSSSNLTRQAEEQYNYAKMCIEVNTAIAHEEGKSIEQFIKDENQQEDIKKKSDIKKIILEKRKSTFLLQTARKSKYYHVRTASGTESLNTMEPLPVIKEE